MLLLLAMLMQPSDSALKALVDSAAARNRVVPPALMSYRAHVESELTVVIKRSSGTESAVQVEQVASDVRWRRTGHYEQHIVGYRAQMAALSPSVLGFLRQAWTVPVLYGNRLGLLFGRDTTRRRVRDSTFVVVHPFAADREQVYEYSGGDTVVTLRLVGGRQIPLVRVHVEPRASLASLKRAGHRIGVFRGDVYLDATRATIVRMRGTFSILGRRARLLGAVRSFFVVDLWNGELDGAYWLPTTQRIEGQVASVLTGDARTALRVVSNWSHYMVNDTAAQADTLAPEPHRLTYAPADSLSRYSGWDAPLGVTTAPMRVDDYADLAPPSWRSTGKPTVDLNYDRFADFFHFDRVEGAYTGLGAALRFRDAAPGLVAKANFGYAWTEATVRGAAALTWTRGPWQVGLRAARDLDNTNVFRTTFTSGPTIEALFTQDEYDYVDRRSLTLSATRTFGPTRIRLDLGPVDDKPETSRLRRPPIFPNTLMPDSLFRPNRGVLPETYGRAELTVDVHPDVDLQFVRPGVGAQLHYEVAAGWERAEGRIVGRQFAGPLILTARADGGIVTGHTIPPQQLFQIGTLEGLTAYDYKQFGGDHAAVLQTEVGYLLPVLRSPIRLGQLWLPSPSPELAVGVRSGWAEASTAAARTALLGLGPRVDPATNRPLPFPTSSPSDGFRTSLDFLVRAFGGALGVGAARALDGRAPQRGWSFLLVLGSSI